MKLRHLESDFFTHQPVLYAAVMDSKGPILELGCGEGSTPLLHQLCEEQGRILITIDNNRDWWHRYSAKYATPWHKFIFTEDWSATLEDFENGTEWGVIFVDQSPWGARKKSIELLGDNTRYVVLHDCDYFPEQGGWGKCITPIRSESDIGERDYSELLPHWKEFFPPSPWHCKTGPPTLLGSHHVSTEEIHNLEIKW